MIKRDFWNSAEGLLLNLRRRREKVFRFEFKGEVEAKKSAKLANSLAFQAAIRKQMAKLGRTAPISGPVIVEFNFTPSLDRPAPHIHKLPKHYLDLLQWPADSTPADKSRLLLKDDRQVKALICRYWLGVDHSTPEIWLRVYSMTSFVHDLQMCSRIIHGESVGGVTSTALDDVRRDGYGEMVDGFLGNPIDEYRKHLKGEHSFTKQFGADVYEVHRLYLQQRCQEKFLNLVEFGPERLAGLLAPYLRKRKFPALESLSQIVADQQRNLYSIISIDLGPSAVREGESNLFKDNVRKALAAERSKQTLLFPLLTTVGATILYVPPKGGKVIDIDNLARRVIPFVHEELTPPSTLAHVAKAFASVQKSEWAENNRQELKALNRLPNFQVSKYQVFELRRSDTDPDDGKVELIIDGGLGSFGPWHKTDEVLDAWEKAAQDH